MNVLVQIKKSTESGKPCPVVFITEGTKTKMRPARFLKNGKVEFTYKKFVWHTARGGGMAKQVREVTNH